MIHLYSFVLWTGFEPRYYFTASSLRSIQNMIMENKSEEEKNNGNREATRHGIHEIHLFTIHYACSKVASHDISKVSASLNHRMNTKQNVCAMLCP